MKLTQIVSVNALMSIGLGIAFGLYAPLMMAFFGIADIPSDDVVLYWSVASFTRIYGVTMIGFGLLLWGLRNLITESQKNRLRGLLFSLVFANGLGLFVVVTQQVSVWQGMSGWVLGAYYAVFMILYIYLLMRQPARVST